MIEAHHFEKRKAERQAKKAGGMDVDEEDEEVPQVIVVEPRQYAARKCADRFAEEMDREYHSC